MKQEIVRLNDQYFIKVFLTLENKNQNYITVEFLDENNFPDYIISCSTGYIKNNKIYIKQFSKNIEICIALQKNDLQCIISYINNEDIVFYDQHLISGHNLVLKNDIDSTKISTVDRVFDKKLYTFKQQLKTNTSKWRLLLKTSGSDIKVKVLKFGNLTRAAFGTFEPELSYKDFVFTLYPGITDFIIPRELIRSQEVGCFELVKSDFHSIDIYYKMSISNAIHLKTIENNLSITDFRDIFGKPLDQNQWEIKNGLPIRSKK